MEVNKKPSHENEMSVTLIECTRNAKELLIFTKDTRMLNSPDDYRNIFSLPFEEKEARFQKVFSSISSPLEFVDFIFLISNVTRAFTHQIVRHRVGVSFAQQTHRAVDMSGFGYMAPDKILDNDEALDVYEFTMESINNGYLKMVDMGIDTQDARGVLPTNIHTNILFKCNLRVLIEMSYVRMCVRAAGEFQKIVLGIRECVSEVYPWIYDKMGPMCVSKGICAFPVFDRCPIKATRPWLNGPSETERNAMRIEHSRLMGKYTPQPKGDGK